ncbi:MAG: protein kinase [Methyloversatilis discipulorum]|uniref:protein kinase domain-containing protein n=1 Tax=Methyloversatilis discipulorum TaxID=1119528 RepID=UPI0026E9DAA5|nr:protein kinase [Methyloversatilis discipulorum]MBT9517842.1 protein kinase [Methyloversatilis discipulorum]
MPDLATEITEDLTDRAKRFLAATGEYTHLDFLAAGGSAAVYRVVRDGKLSALKVFNPKFFLGSGGDAERHRLNVQKRLIGHGCASLVQTYQVTEAEGTAFVEMEYIEWPQLNKKLAEVPDSAIVPLISQLVEAVRFLDSLNIVHRDIKPENIHISPDFRFLKLLDLGVVREFDAEDGSDACGTDHGNLRPFLATAQYSSPEYLFRLDEPTAKLWRGLNLYQVGAVLHDLIKKEPLFKHEMSIGNRWLVARAVLTKPPSFADPTPDRLLSLKALASRCLIKDLDTRLTVVGWEDFVLEGASDPVSALRGRLAKGTITSRRGASESAAARLDFERTEFMKRFSDRIRGELIHICGTQLPLAVKQPTPGAPMVVRYELAVNQESYIGCNLGFEWQPGLYERSVNLQVGAQILCHGQESIPPTVTFRPVGVAVIQEAEDEAVSLVTSELAYLIGRALDRIESQEDVAGLHGWNFQSEH